MYQGNDYLPEIFEQWMSEANRNNFVILSDADEIVGFFSISQFKLDETDVYVEQALRLRHDVRGLNMSKTITKWIGEFAKIRSKKPLLLSMSMLMENDYARSISSEYKHKVEMYASGTDTRTVIDTGLFAKIPVTQTAVEQLKKIKVEQKVKTVPNEMIFDELKSLGFNTLAYFATTGAYILRQNFYPFLIDSKSSVDLVIANNPNLCKRATIRTLRSKNVLSIGTINPVGYNGLWNSSIDLYGTTHREFMAHLTNHALFFINKDKDVFSFRINIPVIENIEDTEFFAQLSQLKSGKLWFTPNFVNLINVDQ